MKVTDKLGQELKELNLGIVNAGETKEFSYYLVNDSEADVTDIEIKIDHPEVVIIKTPKELRPQDRDEFTIKWSPPQQPKQGLKTVVLYTFTSLWS